MIYQRKGESALVKIVLVVLATVVGLLLLYAYVKYLFDEGFDHDEVYLHLFHDVPLRFLRRRKEEQIDDYSYRKKPREYEKVDPDSYPSAYCWNCDPEVVALMNAPPADREHDNQLLRSGGWKCTCGRVNAVYVSSCSCGRNKNGETPTQSAAAAPERGVEEDELRNAAAIREYKKLLDDGIITAGEFEAKKKQLLEI